MTNLLKEYKIRLSQLNKGSKELYAGEKYTIQKLIRAMEKELDK